MVTMASFFPSGSASAWESKVWSMLAEACATQADRNNMSYGAGEPFADATDLTLTNATVENGYCRNTVFAAEMGDNVIPTMTAETTSSWTLITSPVYTASSNYPGWKSADKNGTTCGLAAPAATVYLYLTAPSTQTIMGYTVTGGTGITGVETTKLMKDWKLQGSADGSTNWTDLDTQSNQTAVAANGTNTYFLSTPASYRYFRFAVTATQSYTAAAAEYIGFGEIALCGTTKAIIPTMTSNTAPSGTVSASSDDGSHVAWYAMDKSALTGSRWASNAVAPGWLRYSMTAARRVVRYAIGMCTQATTANPRAWQLQGSTDGTNWDVCDTRSGVASYGDNNLRYYDVSNPGTYAHYRLYVTGINGSTVTVGEFQLIAECTAGSVDAATIDLAPIAVSGATAGRIIFTGYNADASAILDVGNTGSNLVEVYPMISGSAGSALAFTSESLGSNKWRFTSADISITSATSFGVRFKSFARSIAPNFRLYEALFVWR